MKGCADAVAVLAHFTRELCGLTPLAKHQGFSGALIWRAQSKSETLCLRAWPPEDPTAERLSWIHSLMGISRSAGLPFVPTLKRTANGASWIRQDNRLWELSTWMPGTADFMSQPSIARIEAACTALAQIHGTWSAHTSEAGTIPAVKRRLHAHREWLSWISHLKELPANLELRSPRLHHLCESAWTILHSQANLVPQLLAPWANRPTVVQPCLCDIWHDHLLFTGDHVTGIIDYGGVKLDHPCVDLARMLGSVAGKERTLWNAGLNAYGRLHALSADEQELITLLDQTGTLIGLATWLKWLCRDGRHFANDDAVAKRMSELLSRCPI